MYLEPPTDEQWRAIYDEFNMTDESLREDVNYLINWLEKQPHLPNVKDEEFLRAVLIRNKNSLERTKNNLETYYTMKAFKPDLLTKLRVCSIETEKAYKFFPYFPMPKLTSDGYRVIILRISPHDASTIPSPEVFIRMMHIHAIIQLRFVPARGNILISDAKNYSLSYLTFMGIILKRLLESTSLLCKQRQHKLYSLNTTPAFDPIISLVKTVMKDIMKRTVFWKKRPEDLAEVIEKDCLPSDYGGNEKSINELAELWYEELKGYDDWLQSQDEYLADISKRPRDSNMNADLSDYELNGTFRKINID